MLFGDACVSMLGQPGTVGSSADLSLIMASSPRALYSTRRLNSSYSGYAIRVRRSSDNTEQDIGFTGSALGDELDESALTSFVGANSGYVTKWYDQSGNAYDATQATTAKQPQIVNAGTVEKKNGIVAPYFSTTSSVDTGVTNNHTFMTMPFCFGDGAMTGIIIIESTNTGYYQSALSYDFATSGRVGIGREKPGFFGIFRVANDDIPALDTDDFTATDLNVMSIAASEANSATGGVCFRICTNGSHGSRIMMTGYSGSLPSTSNLGGQNFVGHMPEAVFYGSELSIAARKSLEYIFCVRAGATQRNPNAITGTAYGLSGLKSVAAFRKIVSDYDGYCCTLKRSSDAAFKSFGFDGSGVLDTSAISSWVGSGSATLACWMDQTGNGNDWLGSHTGISFVASGSFNTIDGTHPAPTFSNQEMFCAYPFLDSAYTVVSTIKKTNNAYSGVWSRALSSNAHSIGYATGSPAKTDLQRNGNSDTKGTLTIALNSVNVVGFRDGTGYVSGNTTTTPAVNGVDDSTLTLNYGTLTKTTKRVQMGRAGPSTDSLSGNIAEVAIAASSLSTSDQNAIETSMGTRFGVTIT